MPVSTTLSFMACTWMAELGRLAFIRPDRSTTSFSTRMSRERICLPWRVEEEGVGLAHLVGQQEDAARRAHHGIDHVGIGDQHVARILVELHHGGLVQAQGQALMAGAIMRRDRHHSRAGIVRRRLARGGQRDRGRQQQQSEKGLAQGHY